MHSSFPFLILILTDRYTIRSTVIQKLVQI